MSSDVQSPSALPPLEAMPLTEPFFEPMPLPVEAKPPAAWRQGLRVAVRLPVKRAAAALEQRPIPWQLQARVVRPRGLHRVDIGAVRELQADWLKVSGPADSAMRAALRARLVGQGLTTELRDEALACAAAKAQRALGQDPSDAQIHCAQGLLDGHFMDMAHAEGKSLALAMAAGSFALSGEPVHIFVANDFLAARDARVHAPLFVALGLRLGVITARSTPAQRQAAYAADVVYGVASVLARDHLRDSHRKLPEETSTQDGAQSTRPGRTSSPLFARGLCCALVDDADQVLLDEATTPLDLVEVHEDPELHAACIVALAVARRVRLDVDAVVDLADCSVEWTDVGQARVDLLSKPLGDAWLGLLNRQALLSQALVALHALHADHDYLVRDGRVELLAPAHAQDGAGQEWPRTLQTMVEIKEGCRPSPTLRTIAQTRLQRFFPLYQHLAGTGALQSQSADELRELYGLRVVAVPRQSPNRLQELPQQVFEAACLREAAAVQRIKRLQADKRATLVGVNADDAARALSAALQAAGVDHVVADGHDDAHDSRGLEQAGQPGAVTVLTAHAARGVTAAVAPEVAVVGGLHALELLDTPCARTRRRFLARAAPRGLPGSAETWHAADMPCWDRSWLDLPSAGSPQWMVDAACRMQQVMQRWSTRRERRRVLAEPPLR